MQIECKELNINVEKWAAKNYRNDETLKTTRQGVESKHEG